MAHRTSTPLPYETPPYDRSVYRLTDGSGGRPERGRIAQVYGDPEYLAGPGGFYDRTVYKQRGPWAKVGNYIPAADPIRWTDSGPIRPEVHMHTSAWRRWSGGAFQWEEGMHTSSAAIRAASLAYGGAKSPRNKGPRGKGATSRGIQQNKLTTARYRGQTYSQTTRTLG